MTIRELSILAALDDRRLDVLLERLPADGRRGRPWACSRRIRVLIACVALRTNLTVRELAAVVGISKSTAHRILAAITPHLAALRGRPPSDRRWSWVLDGTLIPTRDHRRAPRSKNYRWSCNAQVLIRRRDRRVLAIAVGGRAIAMTRSTTADPSSKGSASSTDTYWRMVGTAACASW